MDPTKPLTLEDVRAGASAAIECRRITMLQAIRLGGFMAGLGLLLLWAGYLAQGQISPWAFLLPVALAAIVTPSSIQQMLRLYRLKRELEAAERAITAGKVVRGQDIPSLGFLPPA